MAAKQNTVFRKKLGMLAYWLHFASFSPREAITQHTVVAQHHADSQRVGSTCHAAAHLDPGVSDMVGCANPAVAGLLQSL